LVPLCDKCFVVSGDNVETDVYHLPSMWHVHMGSQNKVFSIREFATLFL
jgi:hypothetical protein